MLTSRWAITVIAILVLLGQQVPAAADSVEEHLEKAKVAQMGGDHTKAIEELTRAIRLGRSNADAYFKRALSYEKLGNYPEAISDYGRAIQLDPHMGLAYNNRGSVYY